MDVPKYHRALLKISGEALAGEKKQDWILMFWRKSQK